MEAVRREKIIKKLRDIISSLESDRPKVYETLIDITQELFLPIDARVVLVMNHWDYKYITSILDIPYTLDSDLEIRRNIMTPHGNVEYVIIDNTVNEMYGFTIDNPRQL